MMNLKLKEQFDFTKKEIKINDETVVKDKKTDSFFSDHVDSFKRNKLIVSMLAILLTMYLSLLFIYSKKISDIKLEQKTELSQNNLNNQKLMDGILKDEMDITTMLDSEVHLYDKLVAKTMIFNSLVYWNGLSYNQELRKNYFDYKDSATNRLKYFKLIIDKYKNDKMSLSVDEISAIQLLEVVYQEKDHFRSTELEDGITKTINQPVDTGYKNAREEVVTAFNDILIPTDLETNEKNKVVMKGKK